MANHTHTTSRRPLTRTEEHPPVTCPTCGGLECLCRPRFFAGQLLTEEDLNRLDRYIIEKNKLHNRYLHGDGVVCGLEVLCHPCPGWVTIKSGYALSPCGEDIIVCEDYAFDLCAKIRECRDRPRTDWQCEPMTTPPPDCRDVEECWYVTLRYREFESRGMTALVGMSQAPRCPQCGGSAGAGGSGCRCSGYTSHDNGHHSTTRLPSARRPPLQCEPTRLCESYVVEVAPALRQRRKTNNDLFSGTLLERLTECVRAVGNVQQKAPNLDQLDTTAALHQACCQFKQTVWEFLSSRSLTTCALLDKVRDILCPSPLPPPPPPPPPAPIDNAPVDPVPAYRAEVQKTVAQLQAVLLEYLKDCICMAFLPSCPEDPGDPRIIVACVTVKGEDCHIVDICNLRGRHYVWTWPNVLYWLSIFPIIPLLRQVLEQFCCGRPERSPLDHVPLTSRARLFTAAPDEEADGFALLRTLLQLLAQGMEGSAFGDPVHGSAFAAHVGGDRATVIRNLQQEQPDLQVATADVNWPLEVWTLHQLLQPFLALGESRTVAYTRGDTVMGFGAHPITDLRDEVAQLSRRLEEQQRIIEGLQGRPSGPGA